MTLELRDLAIGYPLRRHPPRRVAQHLDIQLKEGTFTCLLGPNGSGKSTLIRTLTGLQRPLHGDVLLDGRSLGRYRPRELARRISLVLTQPVAVGTLPVWSLVAMGRQPYTSWTGRLRSADVAAVEAAMDAVGIGHLAWRPMCELSDGERQKAMIARALAQEPGLMILDEATAHLDLPRRVELMDLLGRLARERGHAILLSSHDLELCLRSADRLWLLSGDGRMREGIPEDLVLDGGFGATFAGTGLTFDPWSGSFQSTRPTRGKVRLAGEPLAARWARRAMERRGFEVVEGAAPLCVTLEPGTGTPAWRIEGARVAQGQRLEALLEALAACPEEVPDAG